MTQNNSLLHSRRIITLKLWLKPSSSKWTAKVFVITLLALSAHAQSQSTNGTCRIPSDASQSLFGNDALSAVSNICGLDLPAPQGGAVIGVLLSLHDTYDTSVKRCPRTSLHNRTAAEQTEAFLVAHHFSAENNRLAIEERLAAFGLSSGTASSLFGASLRDTCSSDEVGIEHVLVMTMNTTNRFSPSSANRAKNSSASCEPRVLAVIGPGSDSDTARLSPILSAFRVPHISYQASSRSFDDTTAYPYLFRTFPSNYYQVEAIVSIIRTFGWKYIAAFASNDNLYGSDGLTGLQYQAYTFCFGLVDTFSIQDMTAPYSARVQTNLNKLKHDTRLKIIVLLALAEYAQLFFALLRAFGITDRVVISGGEWLSQTDVSLLHKTKNPPPFTALIGVMPQLYANTSWINDLHHHLNLSEIIESGSVKKNPFLQAFSDDRFGCVLQFDNSSSVCPRLQAELDVPSNKTCSRLDIEKSLQNIPSTMLLTESIMLAVDWTITAITEAWKTYNSSECEFPTGREIACALENLQQPCPGDSSRLCDVFTRHHATTPIYDVVNLQWNEDGSGTLQKFAVTNRRNLIIPRTGAAIVWNLNGDGLPESVLNATAWPQSICTETCSPGQKRQSLTDPSLHCCWSCRNCSTYEFSNQSNADICYTCPSHTLPNNEHSLCIAITPDYLGWSNGWVISLLIIAALGVIVTVFTLLIFWIHRKEHIIRCADIHLSPVILMSMLVGFLSTPLVLAKPSDLQCVGRVFLVTVSPLLASSGVFVKVNRVACILTNSNLSRQLSKGWKFAMGTPVQLVAIGLLTLTGVMILIIGVIVDSPRAENVLIGHEKVELKCQWSSVWPAIFLSYSILLVIFATFVAFQARKLPDNYNEARLVFMASFSSCVVWIGLAPAYFINKGILRPVILAILVNAQMWGLWLCLFLRRLYDVLIGGPQEQAQNRMTSNMTVYTTNVPRGSISVSEVDGLQTKKIYDMSRAVSDSILSKMPEHGKEVKKPCTPISCSTPRDENGVKNCRSVESLQNPDYYFAANPAVMINEDVIHRPANRHSSASSQPEKSTRL